jgi:ATPase subunit of ABC transporter with duplicated ATPase domains
MKLQINSISKSYLSHSVLNGVSFGLNAGDRVGLIGANGSGKSTLLRIIAGVETADSGDNVKTPKSLDIGYVPQVTDFNPEVTVLDALTESLSLTDSEIYKIYIALSDLGVGELVLVPFGNLSSGQKSKVYLARLLVQKPAILLLDEPTNHLDLDSLVWLERYLASYKGAFLVVSHDRRFLDNTVTKILDLDNGHLTVYGGNYTFYKSQKETNDAAQLRAFVAQESKSERILNRVRVMKDKTQQLEVRTTGADHYMRRKAAASASKAKSTEKMLIRKLSTTGVEKPSVAPDPSVLFTPRRLSSQSVLLISNLTLAYGKQVVISDFTLHIARGERIALAGKNGSGKSTLVKLIVGKLPSSLGRGKVEFGTGVDIGYLPQEHHEFSSPLPLLDYLKAAAHLPDTVAHQLAMRFRFSSSDLKTPVDSLSSGQKSKLALANVMASGANFIILDEPTNYLDIPARVALESALSSYSGTLLVISHDRYFLNAIGLTKSITLKLP